MGEGNKENKGRRKKEQKKDKSVEEEEKSEEEEKGRIHLHRKFFRLWGKKSN